ncbi:MAG: 6-phosphofructokinase [Cytophagales bacterium]
MFLAFSMVIKGLIENNIKVLSNKDVGNTIHIGGTILKTARSDEFRSKSGRDKAFCYT